MLAKEIPPLDVLAAQFTTDRKRGLLIHNTGTKAGLPAGWMTRNGKYMVVHVAGFGPYPAHRILYCMYKQVRLAIDVMVDHKNRNGLDNAERNLRAATPVQNAINKGKASNCGASGVAGVIWCKRAQAWIARISVDGKRIYLGRSRDLTIAVAFRKRAERQYKYSPTYGA